MKKIIISVIVLIILVSAGFYLWQNRHDYFFKGTEPYKTYEGSDQDNGGDTEVIKDDGKEDVSSGNKESDNQENDGAFSHDGSGNEELLEILQNDCDNQCLNKKDTSDYKYCLNICGLSAGETQSSDCVDISDEFNRDVCYKNQAIDEKKSDICDNISDGRLRDSCKDRVIEEILSSQRF